MKMWSMKVIILLLFCYACLSTGNKRVYFVSRNFQNELRWDPMTPAFPGQKVLYTVRYWSDAEEQPFQVKQECQNITALSCDLTAETPSLHDVHYRAQVYANGRVYNSTNRFKPIAETIFGPPTLSYYTTVSSLHVNVTLPLGPNGVSVADIITRSIKGPSKVALVYTLKITYPKWAVLVNKSTTGRFVINLKNNQTKYCGNVIYKPCTEHGRPESESATFCVTLHGDPLKFLPWLLVSAALLAIIITSVVCMCNYVKGGKEKSLPPSLVTTISSPPTVLHPDRNIVISKPEFYVQSEQTVYATIRAKPNMPSVGTGGYSPQDIPYQAKQGSTGSFVSTGGHSPTPNTEDTSAQSSEIYSVVAVAVHVPAEQNEGFQQAINDNRQTSNLPLSSSGESWDRGGTNPKMTFQGGPPSPDLDSCESNPLLLHTVRDTNGELILPSLTFKLLGSTGDKVSPRNSERKLLLSDLIDSKDGPSLASLQSFDGSELTDSGCDDSTVNTPTLPYCNTNYCPSQIVTSYFQQGFQNTPSSDVIFESGYKQNWMPSSKDTCKYRTNYLCNRTAYEEEEEGEEEERGGEERSKQLLLGGWGLKIQE
ncbi:interferon lambda receptor 1 [Epinephelus fuscoguttatus]|uniref:interferon lambda receptor 1 n=1 Tax=Epinephelus fuscoguttatus TaxID=293821 RepID=UPI0020D08DF6|nr:interferon lambda receptor 1 [Epinephelus fuscoguttatus]